MIPLWLSLLFAAFEPVIFIIVGVFTLWAAKYMTGRRLLGIRTYNVISPEVERKLDNDVGRATIYASVLMLVASLLFMAFAPLSINTKWIICGLVSSLLILPVLLVTLYISTKEINAAKHLP